MHFAARGGGVTTPVRDVSLTLAPSDRVGIVGESGSGKSLTAAAIAGLVDFPGRVEADRLSVMEVDPRSSGRDANRVLGRNVAMVFQDPGEALNPAVKLGTQLAEPAVLHLGLTRAQARTRAVEALRSVAIPDPARRLNQHQHELSGGMKQRVCIAIGLMGEARLLIADEPTTALDVTVQRQILRLVDSLGGETAAALLFISHDIAVVAEICDRIVVMYAGFVVEEAATPDLLAAPAHPYTEVLLAASPHMGLDRAATLSTIDGRMPGPDVDLPGCYFAARCPRADETCVSQRPAAATRRRRCGAPGGVLASRRCGRGGDLMAALEVADLRVRYGAVHAVRGVSLAVEPGSVLGLVGESGSGKSTVARAVVGLTPSTGRIRIGDVDVSAAPELTHAGRGGGCNWSSRTRGARSIPGSPSSSASGKGSPRRAARRPASPNCWNWCRWTRRCGGPGPANCPAGSASASRSPGRWPPGPTC